MNFFKYILFFSFIIFLTACNNKIEANMSEPMANFEFTTQNNETLRLDDLKNNWWIANLTYTNCRTVCPRTTANMVDLQNRMQKVGLHTHIVSFSIDPSHDTPDILKKYAEEYNADQDTWDFLTGYDFETIQKISEETFKAILQEGAVGQKTHSYAFYLIDPDGIIVKKYNGMSTTELDMLVDDLQTILY